MKKLAEILSASFLISRFRLFHSVHNLAKAFQRRLDIFHNIAGEHIRVGQIVEVGQTFVLDSAYIQAGLVPADDLLIGKLAPAAFRVGFRVPSFVAFVPVDRVVTIDELFQVALR
jgi:hypothetical protein